VHYVCDESNGWNPDLADIEAKITENTHGLVIINPNNPTGAVYSEETVKGLVDIARRQLAANVVETTPRFGRRTTGRMAIAEGLWVYGRGGRPCRRCGTPITFARLGLGARPTYWCPRCQTA